MPAVKEVQHVWMLQFEKVSSTSWHSLSHLRVDTETPAGVVWGMGETQEGKGGKRERE